MISIMTVVRVRVRVMVMDLVKVPPHRSMLSARVLSLKSTNTCEIPLSG